MSSLSHCRMNAVYVLVTAFLLDLSHSNNEGSSCCYNYDCTSDYSNDAVSNCYMIATFGYDSSTSEGFDMVFEWDTAIVA
eukprot:CAMPEP_0197057360 /NCGR_PEP_ID=MMETSP1384-20130603/96379_1 /TAXON_ID=29189 /ORGANISM="Ammonia sp." /LENGTH=79 /DNA_ID=CAMNT_0042491757 /DNA_START=14 /DNA_END=250 /DNA_ORIENTATION=+